MELEQAQSTVWVLSFHTVMPLVLSVFCNLFFKLILEGLHVLTLNQRLYLSIFYSSGCSLKNTPWSSSLNCRFFFFLAWGLNVGLKSVGVLFVSQCLFGISVAQHVQQCTALVSSFVWREQVSWWLLSSSGLKPSISPFGCLRVSPVRRLPSAFWFASGTAGHVDLLLIPQKTFLPPVQHKPTEVSKTMLFLYNMCLHLTALPGH